MNNAKNISLFFMVTSLLVLGTICVVKIGTIDMHALISTGMVVIPAVIIMGILGDRIGQIVDNPKNKADADYKIEVLNALKKMDKSITLQELNDKLTKQADEPDLPEADDEQDV